MAHSCKRKLHGQLFTACLLVYKVFWIAKLYVMALWLIVFNQYRKSTDRAFMEKYIRRAGGQLKFGTATKIMPVTVDGSNLYYLNFELENRRKEFSWDNKVCVNSLSLQHTSQHSYKIAYLLGMQFRALTNCWLKLNFKTCRRPISKTMGTKWSCDLLKAATRTAAGSFIAV